MVRSTFVALFAVAASFGLAPQGQETLAAESKAPPPTSAPQPLNKDHLAPTGKTLPHPGVPQAEGTTDFDRSIQKKDDRAVNSICKGC